MVSYETNLSLRVRNLHLESSSNGVRVSIQRILETSENFIEISQTETIYGERNANFRHRCSLPYQFGKPSALQIIVYGVRDESGVFSGCLGRILTDIGSLLCSPECRQSFSLSDGAFIDVQLSIPTNSQGIRLQFAATSLHTTAPLAPYLAFILHTGNRPLLLYKSEILRGEKHPEWKDFVLPLNLLQSYPNAPIYIYCYNYLANQTTDTPIGHIATSLSQLLRGVGSANTYMIMDGNGVRINEKTCLLLKKMDHCEVFDFPKLITNGERLALFTAIDMTISNGNPLKEDSLHYIHPHSISAYERVLLQSVPPFLSYSAQPRIVSLGFGALVDHSSQVSQCFNLNGTQDPFVNGIEGLQASYRSARLRVHPYAPSEFSEVIYYASKFAKAESRRRTGLYFVLILFTDGALSNPRRTIDALVDASNHPLTVIAIGVGQNRDFTGLKALESPFLKHSDGRLLARQMFLFVESGGLQSDDILPLLPSQMTHYHCLKT